ncbi:hypothetical protein [Absidia glauca]|uniref:F-box domain-containing protein n=1 Tax=Absidia glauca TaxID=4829 RepID=A0A168MZG7_ABSGL|nr:hypothetical protein [Absidia glauca]
MPLDLLPYEIFQLVCSSLGPSKHTVAECCVVCTSWHLRFMQHLYQDIHLCGPPNFKLFFSCISTTPIGDRSLFIRTLTVQDGDISQEEMEQLPAICPKLEQLTIDGRAHWESISKNDAPCPTATTAAWWPCLRSVCILVTCITPILIQNTPQLTRLTLRCMFDAGLTQDIISLLDRTPVLEYLSIDEIQLSLDHLESIHASCPQLQQLRLVHPTLMHSLRIDNSSTILPAPSLEQLILQEVCLEDNEDGLSGWFDYIGSKYPRLQTLEWWNKAFHGESTLCRLDTTVGLRLISQCSQLTSVRFFHLHVDPLFYQSLLSRRSLLADLGMSYSMDFGPHSQQLTSYSLWWEGKESPSSYVFRLPPSLVRLHLSARLCFGSFDMTLILNQCAYLESLHLDFGSLDTVDEDMAHWRPHPLKRLVMEEVNFSSSFMKMVSYRCRDLAELNLLDCILMEEGSEGKNLVRLIFPTQQFHTVRLCGIRFAHNPSLRAKSVGIYEMDKQEQQEHWYYLSHHATYLSYTPIHYFRYKLPVQAIKQHSIVKPLPPRTNTPLLVPPTELNALRQMQRHDGKFGRDAPCAGYLTLVCRSIHRLYLENRLIELS